MWMETKDTAVFPCAMLARIETLACLSWYRMQLRHIILLLRRNAELGRNTKTHGVVRRLV